MKIILVADINKLGLAGDVVNVARGYGRNYLLPKGFAVEATAGNLKKVEKIKEEGEQKRAEKINLLKAVAEKINNLEVVFKKKADENEHLFGSVSEFDIVEELKNNEITIDKSNVVLEKHIKELGEFEVGINLSLDIKAVLKVKVEQE